MASFPAYAPVHLVSVDCLTALGDARASCAQLLDGTCALRATPLLGREGGDLVPLALCDRRDYDETVPPNWLDSVRRLAAAIPGEGWGGPRRPVFITSSNFGVGSLYAFARTHDPAHLPYGSPPAAVAWLAAQLGWGPDLTVFSHACVSAHVGLLAATRVLAAGLAERALVFSFDFLSPFVAGGFHALKILNAAFPAPYRNRAAGSIGLGDGAAFAVLAPGRGDFTLAAQTLHNEMHHFTANQADGSGFDACLAPLQPLLAGRRAWIKGHGTGTLEAGRLEAETLARHVPGAPLVSWKGSIGHTLGSCGLVELAVACAAIRAGRTPGTPGATDASPAFAGNVRFESFSNLGHDSVLLTSNAFGGAHAALLLDHA